MSSSPLPINNTMDIQKEEDDLTTRRLKVIEGINILLSLFGKEGADQPLFPRKIMTAVSKGQITVTSIEETLQRFEEARFIDCRISAYPKLPKGALQTPKIILIDLDVDWSLKTGQVLIKRSLNKTLTNIKEYCRCSDNEIVIPLVLWTGNGYHIYVVLNIPEPLEYIDEYESLGIKGISREFMLFAKNFLSDNKADSKNNPSFESCLLRVPYTLNSKCLSKG